MEQSLRSQPWFFPDCDRAEAELLLRARMADGAFLVRPSARYRRTPIIRAHNLQ